MDKIWVLTEGNAQSSKHYVGLFSSPELAKGAALDLWPPVGDVTWEFVTEIFERGAWKLSYSHRPLVTLYTVDFWIAEETLDFCVGGKTK